MEEFRRTELEAEESRGFMTNEERKAALEAIIYAADEPATIEQLAAALGAEKLAVQSSLDELVASYASEDRGIEVRAVAGGYKMYTKPQHHDVVRRFIKSLRPPLRLTMPALETLAVISYKQPVTAPEIQEIRGVNTSGVLKTLLDKRLITTAGRKEVIGRPILYRTSKEFLMRFGLSDLQELPSLKEFEALAREALGTDEGIATPGAGDESVLDGMVEGAAVGEGQSEEVQSEEVQAEKVQAEKVQAEKVQAGEVMSTEETQAAQEEMSELVEKTPAVESPVYGEATEKNAAESSERTIEPAPETTAGEGDEEKSRKAVAGE
jgi:segregation and condensation protein B